MKKGYKQLLADASAKIHSLDTAEALKLIEDPKTVFVDVRDVRELEREGMVPGAFHAPRGMLEFWVDPESPYHKPVFSPDNRLVLYCQSGWRSALAAATLMDMGLTNVSDIKGGFSAWKEAGGPVAQKAKKHD